MKKNVFILILCLLFMPLFVNAETCDDECVKVESITFKEKSDETTEVTEAKIEDNKIVLDLNFMEVEDYVKYEVILTNDTDKNYDVSNYAPSSDNAISYKIEALDGDNTIKPGETKGVYLIVTYDTRPDTFVEGAYSKKEDVSLKVLVTGEVINPETGNRLFIIAVTVCIGSFIILIIFNRKLKVLNSIPMIIVLVMIPIYVYATCYCQIDIDSNITIPEFEGRKISNIVKDGAVPDDQPSEFVTGEQGIDFLIPSSDTNGKGVYILASTKDNENPIYYYRGEIYNNNVLFGNYCWKMLRTTETDGIKLVYNGVPENGVCPSESVMLATNIEFNSPVGSTASFSYMNSGGHTIQNSKKITSISNGSVFSSSVTYDTENNKYILSGDKVTKDASFGTAEIKNHHYTCLGGEECATVNFVFMDRVGYVWYIKISNGDTIDDVIENDILNSTNDNNSNVKTYVDNWYRDNMTEYTDYLEDTVWCNDRSLYSRGGWAEDADTHIEDNSKIDNKLVFNANLRVSVFGEPSVTCDKVGDSFTVDEANGNGKLDYPVGLITLDEGNMSGFAWSKGFEQGKENYLYYGSPWWTMTPSLQSANYMYIGVVYSIADNVTSVYVNGNSGGVRPAVSLKSDVRVVDGDGTAEKPFEVILN